MAKSSSDTESNAKRSKVSQTEFPNNTLETALRVARAIWDDFAGKGAAPHEIAMAMDLSPTSGGWRNLCGSSIAYGLTEGGYNASRISLTELGRRIVAPTREDDDVVALVDALMQPRLQRDFFEKYNHAKFPRDEIGRNVLIAMGLPKDRADRAFAILKENGKYSGIIRETKTGPFVAVDSPQRADRIFDHSDGLDEDIEESEANDREQVTAAPKREAPITQAPAPSGPKQLFVAHGKNTKPLEELKKILNEFKIPYKVAIDEPNKGRPISTKVAQLMRECSAGIFIFTKDEKFCRESDKGDLEEVWRPSENIVYELGAASILWDRKIIIVREDGVNFPSDFSDLGYITFKEGEIAFKALAIVKELIALELVKVTAA